MGNLRGKEFLAGADQRVTTFGILDTDVNQPIEVPRVAPMLVKKLIEDNLRHTTRVLRRHFAVADEPLDELLAPNQPAHPGPRRDDLGEGLETEHASVNVHAEVRRSERFDEFLVVSRRGRQFAVGSCVRLHLQEVVRLVLDNDHVVFLRNLVDGPATVAGLRGAGGVLAGCNGVEHEWLAGSSGSFVPVAENLVHGLGKEPLFVHLNSCSLQAKGPSCLCGTGERILF